MDGAREEASLLGTITVTDAAIRQLVGLTAAECYGVVGTAARGGPLGRLLSPDRPQRGVAVRRTPAGLVITVHVVVEHGLNLTEVAATLRSHVAYEIARLTGLEVASVEVHIADVRASSP